MVVSLPCHWRHGGKRCQPVIGFCQIVGGLSAARCSTTISKQEETGSDDPYKLHHYRAAAHYFRLIAHPFKPAYINGNSQARQAYPHPVRSWIPCRTNRFSDLSIYQWAQPFLTYLPSSTC
jgi:hypothetical protein